MYQGRHWAVALIYSLQQPGPTDSKVVAVQEALVLAVGAKMALMELFAVVLVVLAVLVSSTLSTAAAAAAAQIPQHVATELARPYNAACTSCQCSREGPCFIVTVRTMLQGHGRVVTLAAVTLLQLQGEEGE